MEITCISSSSSFSAREREGRRSSLTLEVLAFWGQNKEGGIWGSDHIPCIGLRKPDIIINESQIFKWNIVVEAEVLISFLHTDLPFGISTKKAIAGYTSIRIVDRIFGDWEVSKSIWRNVHTTARFRIHVKLKRATEGERGRFEVSSSGREEKEKKRKEKERTMPALDETTTTNEHSKQFLSRSCLTRKSTPWCSCRGGPDSHSWCYDMHTH